MLRASAEICNSTRSSPGAIDSSTVHFVVDLARVIPVAVPTVTDERYEDPSRQKVSVYQHERIVGDLAPKRRCQHDLAVLEAPKRRGREQMRAHRHQNREPDQRVPAVAASSLGSTKMGARFCVESATLSVEPSTPYIANPRHACRRALACAHFCAHISNSRSSGSAPTFSRASATVLGTTVFVRPGSTNFNRPTRSWIGQFRNIAIPITSHTTCSAGSRRRRTVAVPVASPRRREPTSGPRAF